MVPFTELENGFPHARHRYCSSSPMVMISGGQHRRQISKPNFWAAEASASFISCSARAIARSASSFLAPEGSSETAPFIAAMAVELASAQALIASGFIRSDELQNQAREGLAGIVALNGSLGDHQKGSMLTVKFYDRSVDSFHTPVRGHWGDNFGTRESAKAPRAWGIPLVRQEEPEGG